MIFLAILAGWAVAAIIGAIVWVLSLLFTVAGAIVLGIMVLAFVLAELGNRRR